MTLWTIAATIVGAVILYGSGLVGQLTIFELCLVLFVFSDYFQVKLETRVGTQAIMTVTDAMIIFLVALGGSRAVLVVVLGTLITDLIRQRPWYRNLFNTASRTITFTIMWLVYNALHSPSDMPFVGLHGVAIFALIAGIDYVASIFFVATIIGLSSGQRLLPVYRESYREVSWIYLVTMPAGAVLAFLWRHDPWLAMLGVIPLVMAQRSYQALSAWQIESRRNQALAQESRQLAGKLERLQDTATAMMASLEPAQLLETVSSRLATLMDASASWVVLLGAPPRVVAGSAIDETFRWEASAYAAELQQHDVRQLGADDIARMHPRLQQPWQALVMIPLLLDQQVLGAICLASEQPIELAEDDRRVLLAFAGQAALAMERARLFAELRDKQAELVRSSKLAALGTFSAGIAHEFNNLLAGILGHAELGLMSDDVAEKDEALNVAVRTSMRGKSITRGLLTFARRNDPQRDLNQVREAVDDTLSLVERELVKLNIQVERRFEPVPPMICDLGQISQVVLNLITNARDAMAEKGGGVITVGLRQRGQKIELSVSDTGSGIAPDLLDQVFQPFVTTKGALGGSTTPGTGLGLAISYGIIESHGGTITVESEVGRGTTMIIQLPIAEKLEPNQSADMDEQFVGPLRILLVDDEPAMGNSLGRLLGEHGHEVAVARDGAGGLRLYRQQPFDLVITDVIMPGMSGVTFVERLQAIDPKARVLVITGQPGSPQAEQLLRMGACGVVIKPFTFDELLAAIERGSYARALTV
jgi:signal transduction histidine kinase/ActR/RegA family two-component response regulator